MAVGPAVSGLTATGAHGDAPTGRRATRRTFVVVPAFSKQ